ncbi:MAG: translation initiation factor IF-2, partial [Deltaproteobacteria bacterium]|nr:translation initiation factor IF-2 [Deltaproteobacteria bacterium]
MGKKRIHELAKELSMTSNELLQRIAEMKIMPGVKLGASNSVEENVAADLRRRLGGSSSHPGRSSLVVRRRKKPAESPAESQADSQAQSESLKPLATQVPEIDVNRPQLAVPSPEAILLAESSLPKSDKTTPTPVRIQPRHFDKATIVGTARPTRAGESSNGKTPQPDFLKLSPQQVSPTPPVAPPVKVVAPEKLATGAQAKVAKAAPPPPAKEAKAKTARASVDLNLVAESGPLTPVTIGTKPSPTAPVSSDAAVVVGTLAELNAAKAESAAAAAALKAAAAKPQAPATPKPAAPKPSEAALKPEAPTQAASPQVAKGTKAVSPAPPKVAAGSDALRSPGEAPFEASSSSPLAKVAETPKSPAPKVAAADAPARADSAREGAGRPGALEGKKPEPAKPSELKTIDVKSLDSEPFEPAAIVGSMPVTAPSARDFGQGRYDRYSGRSGQSSGERPPLPPGQRRITHELNPSAATSPGGPGRRSDSAQVVGVKPNWRDGPRPDSPASRSKTVSVGGTPDGDDRRGPRMGPGSGRPGALRPGGPPRPGVRVDGPAQPAAADHDGRKRDRKKKTHDKPDSFSARKRREVIERTDLYPEGAVERTRGKKSKQAKKSQAKTEITVPKAIKRRIKVDEVITVSELAHRLSLKAGDIIKKLMSMGVMAGLNQSLDFDTATLVAAEFDYEVEKSAFDEGVYLPLPDVEEKFAIGSRSPVVTIMGHVDHGKTSLLDYIRKTKIQEGEAGGITQHIGAYHVKVGSRYITFLDTPGHEAFTAMRSRGAQVTDIVILIVAADDGVMPQTREACDHAKAAKVPIIVAVNKVDKPGADPVKIRRQMTELGLIAGDLGGETVFVDISAKTGQGVDELLEMILLQADVLALKARVEGPARGRVIEARLDRGRGAMATLLVGEGVLKQGDPYVCGAYYGKIRALYDDQGHKVDEAGPSRPVEIQGLSGVPLAGDEFIVLEDEKQARQVSQHRQMKRRENELVKTSKLTLENLFDHIKAGAVKGLNLILKTDVQGSLEAILDAVNKLSTPEIKITVLHHSTGGVSETDVMLAAASKALVICFGVRPTSQIQELAEREQVQVRYYDVIYKLIEEIKEAMAGLLDPVKSEKSMGVAEVRAIFMITKVGQVAGSYVSEGKIQRGARARLWRDGQIVYEGRIGSLKREKTDAREVTSGHECGI